MEIYLKVKIEYFKIYLLKKISDLINFIKILYFFENHIYNIFIKKYLIIYMFSDQENCKLGCILITTIVILLGSLIFLLVAVI